MRLATIATSRGLRLHVKARSGYVDVADATGDPLLSSVGALLEAGSPALDTIRGLLRQQTEAILSAAVSEAL